MLTYEPKTQVALLKTQLTYADACKTQVVLLTTKQQDKLLGTHTSPYVNTYVLMYTYINIHKHIHIHTYIHTYRPVALLTTQQQDKLGGLSEEMGETLVAAARLEAAKEALEEELEHSRAREQEAEQVGY